MSETLHLAGASSPVSGVGRFVCTWREAGRRAAWVHVAGNLGSTGGPLLERTLRRAEHEARVVVLDLRELTFIDSSGVQIIVFADIRARRAARRLLVARGPAQVDRVFALTGAAEILHIGDLGPVTLPQVDRQPAQQSQAA